MSHTLKQLLKKIPSVNPTRKELCNFFKFNPQKIEWKKYIPTDYYTGIINNKIKISDNENFVTYMSSINDTKLIFPKSYEIHKVLDGGLFLYNNGQINLYKRGEILELEKEIYYIIKRREKEDNCILLTYIDKSGKL